MLFSIHFYQQAVHKLSALSSLAIFYTYYIIYMVWKGSDKNRFCTTPDLQTATRRCRFLLFDSSFLLDNLKMFCIIYVLFNFLGGIITVYG